MQQIFKYPLYPIDSQTVDLPVGFIPLCVQSQNGEPHLWLLVDAKRPVTTVKLRTYGTGHPIEEAEKLQYLGTYQMHDGALVFHVFIEHSNTQAGDGGRRAAMVKLSRALGHPGVVWATEGQDADAALIELAADRIIEGGTNGN
jgi:hypothetical protein